MPSTGLALVVGLGNPGDRYAQTRHNAGFWFVDELARQHGGSFRADKKFHGELARISVAGHDCLLLKPMLFMNRSGLSVASVANFYRLAPAAVLIAHDEIDLPPGTLRIKQGGGHGGHNGLRDILPALGSPDFWRLRIGVGHPGHRDQVVNYVLARAGAEEQRLLDEAINDAVDAFPLLLAGEIGKAQQTLHSRKSG
ncbi:MAG TPA: aminoacyl-tRNA hydrolase [Gammaproteobacteria bacterium]|nr:aminoacyl-tRNA hydrolase [Gammaproteobacteria bacterium]